VSHLPSDSKRERYIGEKKGVSIPYTRKRITTQGCAASPPAVTGSLVIAHEALGKSQNDLSDKRARELRM